MHQIRQYFYTISCHQPSTAGTQLVTIISEDEGWGMFDQSNSPSFFQMLHYCVFSEIKGFILTNTSQNGSATWSGDNSDQQLPRIEHSLHRQLGLQAVLQVHHHHSCLLQRSHNCKVKFCIICSSSFNLYVIGSSLVLQFNVMVDR